MRHLSAHSKTVCLAQNTRAAIKVKCEHYKSSTPFAMLFAFEYDNLNIYISDVRIKTLEAAHLSTKLYIRRKCYLFLFKE